MTSFAQKTYLNPLKRLRHGSFIIVLKKLVKVKSGKVVQFSSQSDTFGKIAIIKQSRNADLKDVFCVLYHGRSQTALAIKTKESNLMNN